MNRSFFAAIAAAATAAVVIVVTPTGKGVPEDAEFVIPDCGTLADGGEDPTPTDCLFGGPLGLPDGGPRWRGCNQGPAVLAFGTRCIAAPSTVRLGSKLVKLRGAFREVDKKGVELEEPTTLDGGKVR